jgi:hypothetical protein
MNDLSSLAALSVFQAVRGRKSSASQRLAYLQLQAAAPVLAVCERAFFGV